MYPLLRIAVILTAVAALGPPPTCAADEVPPEEELWAKITTLAADPPTTQPYNAWLDAARRQREALLQELRLYQTLYPGGDHQLAAAQLELSALHELGALAGGDFEPLCQRVARYLREHPPDDAIAAEAAYWQIHCRRLTTRSSTTQPTAALEIDADLAAAYRAYLTNYPTSRHVPHMAEELFAHAREADDADAMRTLVEHLEQHFPQHAITAALRGQWRRLRSVGSLFWLAANQPDGGRLDTRTLIGSVVLIVVWSSEDADARRRVQEVERLRESHGEDVQVVGVNLDERRERMTAACAELAIGWQQYNDGLGRANSFAREWGVHAVPHVFVVDRRGLLVGSTGGEDWRQMAQQALQRRASGG